MQIFELMESLENELRELFKDYKYSVKGINDLEDVIEKSVNILQGWKTSRKEEEEFPYILISPIENTSDWEEDTIDLMLIFGVHSRDRDGWKDAALMANKVKFYLNKNYIVGNKFPLVKNRESFKIQFPDAQPYPQWFCFMNLRFNAYNAEINPEWRGEYDY